VLYLADIVVAVLEIQNAEILYFFVYCFLVVAVLAGYGFRSAILANLVVLGTLLASRVSYHNFRKISQRILFYAFEESVLVVVRQKQVFRTPRYRDVESVRYVLTVLLLVVELVVGVVESEYEHNFFLNTLRLVVCAKNDFVLGDLLVYVLHVIDRNVDGYFLLY